MRFYVYGYFDSSGEPFYIGKGFGDRCGCHLNKSCLEGKTMFYCKLRSMLAAGEAPVIKILYSGLTDEESRRLEVELIAKYGRRDIGTGCLCNHTDGGEGQAGRIMSDETRRQISQTKKAAMREPTIDERIAVAKAHAGRKESQETRSRKRASRLDCLAVCSYDLTTGEAIKTYPSLGSVKSDGFTAENVNKVVRGIRAHHKNLGWRLA